MSALLLRQMIGGKVHKPNSDNVKCDLRLVFERSNSTPCSSPDIRSQPLITTPPSPIQRASTPKPSFFELIAKDSKQAPKKKLYSCPHLQINKIEKKKEKVDPMLYNSFAVTTQEFVELPNEIENFVTFEFKGGENQTDAWNDFKTKVKDSKYSVVVCANIILSFEDNQIRAKAITGTAQKKLEDYTSKLPNIEYEDSIKMIEALMIKEKVSIYSTSMFYYSEVKPVKIKRSEFESVTGKKYRFILTGNVFPCVANEAKKYCGNVGKIATSGSILY